MIILSEEEMAAKLDFRQPLRTTPDEPESIWCIPFEFGGAAKGTRISIAKAREIASELRASVAEAELRQMRRHFADEKRRGDDLSAQLSKSLDETQEARTEIALLKRKRRTGGER